jgi:hypothetical protein
MRNKETALDLSHALNNTLAAERCFLELQLRPVNDSAQRVNYRNLQNFTLTFLKV